MQLRLNSRVTLIVESCIKFKQHKLAKYYLNVRQIKLKTHKINSDILAIDTVQS